MQLTPQHILHAITNLSRDRRQLSFSGAVVYVDTEHASEKNELRNVVVICEVENWKFFCEIFEGTASRKERYRFEVAGKCLYKFVLLSSDLEALRGLQFEKAILYNAFLTEKQFLILQSCFHGQPLNIETIID